MNRKLLRELSVLLSLLAGITLLVAAFNFDLVVSSKFYIDSAWPVGEQFFWKLLYKIDRLPAIILAASGLAVAISGLIWQQKRNLVKPGFFLVLLLALGPGLLVNTIFKDHWGRPRPREVQQFGGARQFQQPWQPGIIGKGRSFPSGHSSAAFYLCAPYFIYRYRRPQLAKAWFICGVVFGVLMSYARIAQGAHFLSDTIWAFGMVWMVALVLSAVLLRDDDKSKATEQKQ